MKNVKRIHHKIIDVLDGEQTSDVLLALFNCILHVIDDKCRKDKKKECRDKACEYLMSYEFEEKVDDWRVELDMQLSSIQDLIDEMQKAALKKMH